MKVLHLFSNSKWTGPADPALTLCHALRSVDVHTDFACAAGPDLSRNRIVDEARARDVAPILALRLSKHRHPLRNWSDARKLRAIQHIDKYDLVHCHLDNDHAIAAACGGLRILRSSYHGTGFPEERRFAHLLDSTAFVCQASQMALEHDAAHFGFSRDRMEVVHGAVDLSRFDPEGSLPDYRAVLGIGADAFVVGIVARMQTHRRFEDFLHAAAEVTRRCPRAHFVVVGRGTKQDRVAMDPVRQQGLSERVHFTGFLKGDDYLAALKAFDVKVFLVPGSDGTCRAVREAMAMGKPILAARRGMLPELVDDGTTGYIADDAESLIGRLLELEADGELVAYMGGKARAKAVADFDPAVQARRVKAIYERVLDGGGG